MITPHSGNTLKQKNPSPTVDDGFKFIIKRLSITVSE